MRLYDQMCVTSLDEEDWQQGLGMTGMPCEMIDLTMGSYLVWKSPQLDVEAMKKCRSFPLAFQLLESAWPGVVEDLIIAKQVSFIRYLGAATRNRGD